MKTVLTLIASAVLLAACGPSPQPVYQQQPQIVYQQPAPVQYQQPAPVAPVIVQQHDNGVSTGAAVVGAAAAGALGYMAGKSNTAPTSPTVIREKTVIIKEVPAAAAPAVAPKPVPAPAPVVAPKPTPAPAPKPIMPAAAPKPAPKAAPISLSKPKK